VLPDNTHLIHSKSDRVLRLTASCIQSIVRSRYAHDMPMNVAIDLARAHDVRSAVQAYEQKLELHQGLPHNTRIQLAGTEAAISRGVIPAEEIDRTIAVRRGSLETMREGEQGEARREILVARLREVRRECEQWAREYSRFFDDIASLYQKAARDLRSLHLDAERARQADVELEQVLVLALHRAGQIESNVRAVA
jgi:hypothetical protein